MYYSELINEINNLKEMMVIVDGNLKHNINVFWAALGIGLALVGLISVGWLRYFVSDSVEKRLEVEVSRRLKEYSLKKELIIPTLLNGRTGSNVHFWKDDDGYVVLDGVVSKGLPGKVAIIFPSGYRPIEKLTVPVISSVDSATCIIDTDGSLTIYARPESIIRFGNLKFKAF